MTLIQDATFKKRLPSTLTKGLFQIVEQTVNAYNGQNNLAYLAPLSVRKKKVLYIDKEHNIMIMTQIAKIKNFFFPH